MANKAIALETSEASITTAAITIKALQVGRKQMTQSIFRQIPGAPLIDEDKIMMNGIPWGHVNYFFGEEKDIDPRHARHVVFQQGQYLKRSLCFIRFSDDENWHAREPRRSKSIRMKESPLLRSEFFANVLAGELPMPIPARNDLLLRGSLLDATVPLPDGFRWLYAKESDVQTTGSFPVIYEPGAECPGCFHGADCWDRVSRMQALAISKIKEAFESCWTGGLPSLDEIKRRRRSVIEEWQDYCRRWDEMMEHLESIEQLFIAV